MRRSMRYTYKDYIIIVERSKPPGGVSTLISLSLHGAKHTVSTDIRIGKTGHTF